MRQRLYRATGFGISAALRMLGVKLRVTGIDRLPNRPVLFVANHFTRFETFLLPYAIHDRFGQPVRSLAKHGLFDGPFGRYMRAVGSLSTRDPRRNRTLIGSLMTGRSHWLIYPEGGLVKDKKTVENGRLSYRRSGSGERRKPPHTGAAMMVLKAEVRKRRYLDACARGDQLRRAFYEERYELDGPQSVAPRGAVIVPVNITFARLRARGNMIHRLMRLCMRGLGPEIDEEMRIEGSLLSRGSEISLHFDDPIEIDDYLDGAQSIARRFMWWLRPSPESDLVLLRGQARRLTDVSMRRVYASTEINFDHLFCYGLRALRQDVIPTDQFLRALYLAALELRADSDVRLHPVLNNGITALSTGQAFGPLESIVRLAENEGVLRRENGSYVIDRAVLEAEHALNEVRLRKMIQVIANEVEPNPRAATAIARSVNLDDGQLGVRLPQAIYASDRAMYRRDYNRWRQPGVSRPETYGAPFFLEAPEATIGVVLAHGYLACPEQLRPMAERLHAAGVSVYALRLEGHGTAPGQLAHVTVESWLDSVEQARTVIRHHCPKVVLGGFSLGGVLAAIAAARRPDVTDGLVLINAPLRLRHPLAALVPALVGVSRTLDRFSTNPSRTRLVNVSESPDINYDADDLHGVHQVRRAMRVCRRSLGRVTAPTLILQSDNDPVVAPRSADMFLSGIASEDTSVVRLPAGRHVVVRGASGDVVHNEIVRFVRARS